MTFRLMKLSNCVSTMQIGALAFALTSICACSPKLDQKQYMTCVIAISVINYPPAVNAMYVWGRSGVGKELSDSVTAANGPALAQEIYAEHSGTLDKRTAFLDDYNSSVCRSIHGQEKLAR
jgi:hypothetical protein